MNAHTTLKTNNKQQTTNNKQEARSKKQEARSKKQEARSKKQEASTHKPPESRNARSSHQLLALLHKQQPFQQHLLIHTTTESYPRQKPNSPQGC
ncbi:hypothetical protein LOY46_16120 [Pseudomonas sichuanensis]|uniref:hypothetical protein n=1 Tax=Pseudomonas sichuanensis TaxID=2213015 RepID=UPI00215F0626|nr:hypothetical protein [Pseudomonas sichuanensis]UVK81102.1 hypothetical protein LOY46_16120 [Pseudomonas sichuanensis]